MKNFGSLSLVSLIDNFMVAGLGDAKMAGINVANQINFVYFVVLWTLCGAGGIFLAQFRGANDMEGMKQAYRFKALLAFAVSASHFILCWTIPEQLLSVMTAGNAAQAEIVEVGSEYLKLVSFTWFPIATSTAIGTAFRDAGKPRIPLFISVAATIINTIGNYLLKYGNFGAPRLEASGAAIATITARLAETAAFLVFVIAAYLPIWTVLNAQFAISRSGGDTALGMYVDLSVNLLLFIPGALLLTRLTSIGPVLMFAIVKSSDFVKLASPGGGLKKKRG